MAAVCALLAGCSASADGIGGADAKSNQTERFDAFQAAADNGRILVVVGNNGVVVTSVDRGASWQRREIAKDAALIGIAACADGSFAALDFFHRVWFADASATSWKALPIKEPANPLAIACDRSNRLWVVGSGATIAMSADRGASWTKTVVGDDLLLATIQFVDGERVFVTGEFGSVFASNDGGATWKAKTKIGADFYPYAAHFSDAQNGWVAGLAGVVMRTEDGGTTWQKTANPVGAPVYGLAVDRGEAVGVGVNGLMFRFREANWTLADVRPVAYLRAVLPLPEGKLLLAGSGGALELATPAAAAAN